MGQSVRHIAVHMFQQKSCAIFHKQPAKVGIGEDPVCILTSLKPGGEVTQTCFNPNNPVAISLKEVKGIELDFDKNGQPVSIIVKNPKMMGLDPSQEEHQAKDTCHCECKQK